MVSVPVFVGYFMAGLHGGGEAIGSASIPSVLAPTSPRESGLDVHHAKDA